MARTPEVGSSEIKDYGQVGESILMESTFM